MDFNLDFNTDNSIKRFGLPVIIGIIITCLLGFVGHNTYGIIIGALIMGLLTIDEMTDLGINSIIVAVISVLIIDFAIGGYNGFGWLVWDLIIAIILAFIFGWLGVQARGMNGENTLVAKYLLPLIFGLIITIFLGVFAHTFWVIIIGALIMGFLSANELGDLGLNSLILGLISAIVIDFACGGYNGFGWFIWDIIVAIVVAFICSNIGARIKDYYY